MNISDVNFHGFICKVEPELFGGGVQVSVDRRQHCFSEQQSLVL